MSAKIKYTNEPIDAKEFKIFFLHLKNSHFGRRGEGYHFSQQEEHRLLQVRGKQTPLRNIKA